MSEQSTAVAVTAAFVALGGVLVSAAVSLWNGILTNRATKRDLIWKKEQWLRDKRESAYLECLRCLNSSRIPTTKDIEGSNYIEQSLLKDHIHLLQYSVTWMTMAAVYSPEPSGNSIREARDELHACIKRVQFEATVRFYVDRTDGSQDTLEGWPDPGLSVAVEKAITVLADSAKSALEAKAAT
jgi:hypothetical protein